MFFVNYLPEFLYQPLKLSNVRPIDFANSKHAQKCLLRKRNSSVHIDVLNKFVLLNLVAVLKN